MIQQFSYGSRQYRFSFDDAEDHIARMMRHGFYEAKMLEAIKDLNLEGIYLDAGAHVGNHTVYFANECPSARVLAFEPCVGNFRRLQENVKLNDFRSPAVVELHASAIGQRGQRVRTVKRDLRNTGMEQCILDERGQEARSIDDVLEEIAEPLGVLKLDLAGFEEHALRGAVRSIKRHRPLLVIEASEQQKLEAQESILSPLGYARGKRWNSTPTYFWSPRAEICVVIMTFDRPGELQDLLEDIEREKGSGDVFVIIYDDCSTQDYDRVRNYVNERGWLFFRTPCKFGKRNFWKLFNLAFSRLKSVSFQHLIFLQDDLRLCTRFFDRAVAEWERVRGPRNVALNLHIDHARERMGGWAKSGRTSRGSRVKLSGWIDCIFMADRRFLRALDYRVNPIPAERWQRNHLLGSGVGEQLTKRLHSANYGMSRVRESLVYHRLIASQMNPAERVRNRASTVRFADGFNRVRRLVSSAEIVASLATTPARLRLLEATIESLLRQVDRLNVYLNGFNEAPLFLKRDKITFFLSHQFRDLGDLGKFWWASELAGYYFTVDDDILYPPDYCGVLIQKIEELERKTVVGVHGMVLAEPFRNYYADRRVFHFEAPLTEDRRVHILGTGTLAYHHGAIQINAAESQMRNAADIFFGIAAQRQSVPLVAVARGKQWLSAQKQNVVSIYSEARRRGGDRESELIKSVGTWCFPD